MENFEILGATDDAVANLITKMQEMGLDQAPAMFEGVVRKIALDGMIGVSAGGVCLGIFLVMMWILFKGIKTEFDADNKNDGLPYVITGIIGGGITFVITVIPIFANNTIVKFLDPEAWFYAHLFNKLL